MTADTRTYRVVDEDGDHYEITGDPMDALNAAYRERAHLIALLAAIYPSDIGQTDPATPDWYVVTVDLPTGQAAWHISPDDRDLFGHVDLLVSSSRPWDRHTTAEKYRRIDQLTGQIAKDDIEAVGGHRGAR